MFAVTKRPIALVAFVLLALVGTATAASASADCRVVQGRFTLQLSGGPGCASPVGLCGSVDWKGSLRADSSFVATSIVTTDDTPFTGVIAVTGDNLLVTAGGQISTKDVILLAPNGDFTEIDTVVGGTGDFAGATGSWIATGTSTATDGEGTFVGEICWP